MKGIGIGQASVSRPVRATIELAGGHSLVHVQPDNGCSVAPKCVECPLERCRYDTPGGLTTIRRQVSDARIVELRRSGMKLREIAEAVDRDIKSVGVALRRNGL